METLVFLELGTLLSLKLLANLGVPLTEEADQINDLLKQLVNQRVDLVLQTDIITQIWCGCALVVLLGLLEKFFIFLKPKVLHDMDTTLHLVDVLLENLWVVLHICLFKDVVSQTTD